MSKILASEITNENLNVDIVGVEYKFKEVEDLAVEKQISELFNNTSKLEKIVPLAVGSTISEMYSKLPIVENIILECGFNQVKKQFGFTNNINSFIKISWVKPHFKKNTLTDLEKHITKLQKTLVSHINTYYIILMEFDINHSDNNDYNNIRVYTHKDTDFMPSMYIHNLNDNKIYKLYICYIINTKLESTNSTYRISNPSNINEITINSRYNNCMLKSNFKSDNTYESTFNKSVNNVIHNEVKDLKLFNEIKQAILNKTNNIDSNFDNFNFNLL